MPAPKTDLRLRTLDDEDDEVDLGVPTGTVSSGSSRPSLSFAFDLPPPTSPTTPAHRTSMFSPSSPDLKAKAAAARPSLSRSQTLPRMDLAKRPRKNVISLDVEEEVLRKIRRWILGIAVGACQDQAR